MCEDTFEYNFYLQYQDSKMLYGLLHFEIHFPIVSGKTRLVQH